MGTPWGGEVSPRWAPLSPGARARPLGGEVPVFQAWYPGNPEGRRGREELSFSEVVQPRGRVPDISARVPRADPPACADPAASEPKAKGAASPSGVRGEVRAPPIPRGRHFVTSLASQQARATRAPPTRPAARPPAASSALRASLPSRLACLPGRGVAHRAARGRAHRKVAAAWTAGTWRPRPRSCPAPLSAAHPRRRDAALPKGNGLRPLPPGDLVIRRLHHLLRGRCALRARQPLPPLHQVGWAEGGPGGGAAGCH